MRKHILKGTIELVEVLKPEDAASALKSLSSGTAGTARAHFRFNIPSSVKKTNCLHLYNGTTFRRNDITHVIRDVELEEICNRVNVAKFLSKSKVGHIPIFKNCFEGKLSSPLMSGILLGDLYTKSVPTGSGFMGSLIPNLFSSFRSQWSAVRHLERSVSITVLLYRLLASLDDPGVALSYIYNRSDGLTVRLAQAILYIFFGLSPHSSEALAMFHILKKKGLIDVTL